MKKYSRTAYQRRIPFKKELKILARDFGLLDRPEVQDAIENCIDYEQGRRRLMKIYETVYM